MKKFLTQRHSGTEKENLPRKARKYTKMALRLSLFFFNLA